MKKVLHISTYYYPQFGGIEQVAYDIVEILKENNLDNRVICFSEDGITKEEMIDGVKVYKVGFLKKISSQAISFEYYFKLKKIIEDYKPDFIHLHLPNPLIAIYLNNLLKNKREIKLILHWHSDIVKQKFIKKFYNSFQKKTLKLSYKIIVTSNEYARDSQDLKKFLNKISVIPNIVNERKLKITTQISEKIQILQDKYFGKKIVFFIGVHREYKGLKYLIEAAQNLNDNYKILIAGSGPLTHELKEVSKNDKKIEFLGKVTDEEKIAYFNISDIFAFPSLTKNEAFGVALAEALYFGVPAVTFNIKGSGVNWVNKNKVTGIEIWDRNPEKLAKAIIEVDKNKQYFSNNAKKWINENFTKDVIKNKLLNVYK